VTVSTATRPAPLRGRRIVSETWVFGDERRTSPRRPPWRIDYNDNRPHRSLRMLTPAEFAKAWTTRELQLAWRVCQRRPKTDPLAPGEN
jgi:hypothetical protein